MKFINVITTSALAACIIGNFIEKDTFCLVASLVAFTVMLIQTVDTWGRPSNPS